jgi:GTPase
VIDQLAEETSPKAVLLGLKDLTSIEELGELARTADLDVVGTFNQNRTKPDPRGYLGSGKLDELAKIVIDQSIEVVIADDELSPGQQRHLERCLKTKIMDRTSLVLAIFAARAQTHEAKLQVELAQLAYLAPRLTRMWTHLSRLGGGIGTRGPGETQLEVDKRLLQTRMIQLRKSLEKVRQSRQTQQSNRETHSLLKASLVGYTNSGKSTLMNRLTEANVLVEDKLFATLDPTTRRITLPTYGEVLISDTVGFIQKLPHQLVDAFMATLEEAQSADVLIHVVDASSPEWAGMLATSMALLKELNVSDTPQILVFNKSDKLAKDQTLTSLIGNIELPSKEIILMSALKDEDLADLFETLQTILSKTRNTMTFTIPYDRMDIVHLLHKHGELLSEEYEEDHIKIVSAIQTVLGQKIMGQLQKPLSH